MKFDMFRCCRRPPRQKQQSSIHNITEAITCRWMGPNHTNHFCHTICFFSAFGFLNRNVSCMDDDSSRNHTQISLVFFLVIFYTYIYLFIHFLRFLLVRVPSNRRSGRRILLLIKWNFYLNSNQFNELDCHRKFIVFRQLEFIGNERSDEKNSCPWTWTVSFNHIM